MERPRTSFTGGARLAESDMSMHRTCLFKLSCFFVFEDAMKREPPPRLHPRRR